MAEMKLQIKDIEPFKSLIRLLSDNFSDLPEDVQLAIYDLVGDGDVELSVGEDRTPREAVIDRASSILSKSDSLYSALSKLYDNGMLNA